MHTFGSFIRELRLSKRIGLRQFARLIGVDASNWNRVEKGVSKPNYRMMRRCMGVLEIVDESEEWHLINQLAMVEYLPQEMKGLLREWLNRI